MYNYKNNRSIAAVVNSETKEAIVIHTQFHILLKINVGWTKYRTTNRLESDFQTLGKHQLFPLKKLLWLFTVSTSPYNSKKNKPLSRFVKNHNLCFISFHFELNYNLFYATLIIERGRRLASTESMLFD